VSAEPSARRGYVTRCCVVQLACALLTILVMGVPSSARAQILIALLLGDRISNETFQLGINVGFAATGLIGVESKFKASVSVSMYGEIRLTERLHLQPELVMKLPGGAREMNPGAQGYPFEPFGEPIIDEVVANGELTRDLRYIGIPVYAKLLFGSLGFGLGPQLSILLRADDTVQGKNGATTIKLERSIRDDLRPVDVGAALSLEYLLSPEYGMRSLRVRAKGYLGMMDIYGGAGRAMHNWNFMIGLDIPIGGSSSAKPQDGQPQDGKPQDGKPQPG